MHRRSELSRCRNLLPAIIALVVSVAGCEPAHSPAGRSSADWEAALSISQDYYPHCIVALSTSWVEPADGNYLRLILGHDGVLRVRLVEMTEADLRRNFAYRAEEAEVVVWLYVNDADATTLGAVEGAVARIARLAKESLGESHGVLIYVVTEDLWHKLRGKAGPTSTRRSEGVADE